MTHHALSERCSAKAAAIFAIGAIAALVAASSRLHDALLLSPAAISGAEVWRLWTGHWVHFSSTHLAWDVGALLLVSSQLNRASRQSLWLLVACGAPAMSLALLELRPEMAAFGGLSGIATGAVTLWAIELLRRQGSARVVGIMVSGLLVAKLGWDWVSTTPLVVALSDTGIRSEPLAHLLGIVAACAITVGRR